MFLQESKRCFLVGVFVLTTAASFNVQSKTIQVSLDGDVKTIGDAIKLAHDGDSIIVAEGIYLESNILIDKAITLVGENFPTIDGENKSWVLKVTASNVTITGMTIRGAGLSYIDDNAGLLLEGVHDCTVENNHFTDNFFAIYLAESYKCRIANNKIKSSALTEPSSGNGIHLWYCRDISIVDNTVFGHRDGLYFEFVKHSRITGNVSHDNLRYGLHFMFSDSCTYSKNHFYENGAGVAVMYTHFVKMTENRLEHNWGASSFGLLLKDITDSEIRGNLFFQNSIGLYAEGCNRILVEGNDFLENGWAVKIMANSLDNRFVRNNFTGNSFQVTTNSRQNFSTFEENYWSNYRGYDLDRDGFGDVPFRPVNLFSIVVEQEPATLILLRSLLVEVLDLAERLIPSLTPETLMDSRPAMGPIS